MTPQTMGDLAAEPASLTPAARAWQLIWPGAMAAQAVYVTAKLGLMDYVVDGPKAADELASATKTNAAALKRLLLALENLGIFTEDLSGKFRSTELGETLRSNHPSSIRAWAIFLGSPFMWKPWGELYETVATGMTAFPHIYGASFFEYLAEHPDDAAIFNAAMSAGSSMSVSALLAAYDFSKFERIVDVGGGQGELLRGILMANINARGVLFDLPAVVAGANGLRTGEVATRSEIVGGDFFEGLPAGGDAYLLKTVIHDWDDEDALRILRNCRHAIQPTGRLLILEAMVTASNRPESGLMDAMALVLGGRETD